MRVALIAVLGLLLLAACGDKKDADDDRRDNEDVEATAEATAGDSSRSPTSVRVAGDACESFPEGVRPGSTAALTLRSGERERDYRVHLPAGKGADDRLPVVLNFHGLGSNATDQEAYS